MIGYIYKIYDNTNGNVYYGSTINKVSDRISRHRTNYKHFVDGKRTNCKSFDIIKNNDWTWNIEEKVEITEKWELYKLERRYIENNECINKNVPTRTSEEYYQANREQINERKRHYRETNREQINERQKQYYDTNREQILEKRKATMECPNCKMTIGKHHKTRHMKTKKCLEHNLI